MINPPTDSADNPLVRPRRIERDEDWQDLADLFPVRAGTTYLNHGSFGVTPQPVRNARLHWIRELDNQPMDFYVRQLEPAWSAAIGKVADFLGTRPENLVFVENATFGMNVVADSFPLADGEEVLSNNHEYGAVHRIWDRACRRRGARHVVARLPDHIESIEQVVDAVFEPANARTRLLVVSHITSPTALIMPVAEICEEARRRGIPVCIDGPHAPAHLPIELDSLGCAFYTASCHKWLAAPLGSGFLFVDPQFHDRIEPQLKSWGRLLPAVPEQWFEEFVWSGTRDPSAYLAIPAAIELLQAVGLDLFRRRIRWMASETTRQLVELTGRSPLADHPDGWYGAMAHVPLPGGDWPDLQAWLWEAHGIEVPVVEFESQWFIRVSHHLYNNRNQVERLLGALETRFSG